MCPDHQILSVYFDGELESPWKEKCEKHLENCPSCRERLEAYRHTRQRLAETSVNLGQSLEGAFTRVWEKASFAVKPNFEVKPRRRFWTSSITIPVPIAAAAGLVMALALAALIAIKQPERTSEPQLAGLEMQEMIPVSDMASFFQYLGSDTPDMVIIRLPETTFTNAGEPRMLRAADYTRAGGSR